MNATKSKGKKMAKAGLKKTSSRKHSGRLGISLNTAMFCRIGC